MPLDTEPGTSADAEAENGVPEGSQFHLPKLGRSIRETIEEYGGSVFPKLNWTAPRVCPLSLLSCFPLPLIIHSVVVLSALTC